MGATMEPIELKPCPFCGEYPSIDEYVTIGGHVELVRIACSHTAPTAEVIGSPEFASKAWNTRAERTCMVLSELDRGSIFPVSFTLTCGHVAYRWDMKPPSYCPECGAKVVDG